jgi:hypothetical protein
MSKATSREGVTVQHVAVPPNARALSTLSRIDYQNALLVETDVAGQRTGEQWARVTLEDAPAEMRRALTRAWSALGLHLGPAGSDRHVLGWSVLRSTPDFALLGASSDAGLRGELLIRHDQHTLLFASFIQQDSDEARGQWAVVEDMHAPVMQQLLEQAVQRP